MAVETGTSLSNLLGKPAATGRKLKSFVGLIHHLFDHKAAEIGANILIAVIRMPFDLTDPAPGLLFHLNIMIALVVLEQNVCQWLENNWIPGFSAPSPFPHR